MRNLFSIESNPHQDTPFLLHNQMPGDNNNSLLFKQSLLQQDYSVDLVPNESQRRKRFSKKMTTFITIWIVAGNNLVNYH
jgi:hypothetical protein